MRSLLMLIAFLAACASAALLGGCAAPAPEHYAAESPKLDLERYFDGVVDAWGMVQDRSGTVTKRFHAVITGRWEHDTGTLDEDFTFSDGTRQRRVWTLRRQADGSWRGTAADVVGSARGIVSGNALHWTYTLRVPVDGRSWDIDFDDWMFLQDEQVMLNRATMSKFGVRVGEITLAFRRRG